MNCDNQILDVETIHGFNHISHWKLLRRLVVAAAGQLAWLVYLTGSVVGGRISNVNTDEYDTMDGQLVCRLAPPPPMKLWKLRM